MLFCDAIQPSEGKDPQSATVKLHFTYMSSLQINLTRWKLVHGVNIFLKISTNVQFTKLGHTHSLND